jgi:hypothetical protein
MVAPGNCAPSNRQRSDKTGTTKIEDFLTDDAARSFSSHRRIRYG